MSLVPYQCQDRPNCGEVFIAHDDRDALYCPYCAEVAATISFDADPEAVEVI